MLCALPLAVVMVVGPSAGARPDCSPEDFAAARQRLGPAGRVEIETSTVGPRLTARRGDDLVWSTLVRSQDCDALGQIADIGVERALRRPETSAAVGDVPSLAEAAPTPEPAPEWHLEVGAGGQLELAVVRGGGAVDLFLSRRGLGARLEVGAFGPRGGSVQDAGVEIGTLDFFTVHGLLGLEGCPTPDGLPGWFRPCAGLGGGLEWVHASVTGDRLFRTEAQSQGSGRLDGTLRLGWTAGPAGLEASVRVTWRPGRPSFRVEGATVDAGLPLWTAGLGVRGWLKIF